MYKYNTKIILIVVEGGMKIFVYFANVYFLFCFVKLKINVAVYSKSVA